MSFLDDMTPDFSLTAELRQRIDQSLSAFSDQQKRMMVAAGVRYWDQQSLPPEIEAACRSAECIERPSGEAWYTPQIRTIRLRSNANTYVIRHETAHAWDHVRTGNVRSLRGLSGDRLLYWMSRRYQFWSDTHLANGFECYRRRIGTLVTRGFERTRLIFDLRDGYSMRSVREFYAEGYAIFHSNQTERQARLWLYARELFNDIQRSAVRGQTVPNGADFQAIITRLGLPSPGRLR